MPARRPLIVDYRLRRATYCKLADDWRLMHATYDLLTTPRPYALLCGAYSLLIACDAGDAAGGEGDEAMRRRAPLQRPARLLVL